MGVGAQEVQYGLLGHLVDVELGVAAGRVAVDAAGAAGGLVGEEFGAHVLPEGDEQPLHRVAGGHGVGSGHRASSVRKRFSRLSQISSAWSMVRISGGRILRTLP